jgi:BioD-like phosphotransacetylase family protein
VARILGARPLLISEAGIGRAIDAIALCATFLTARGADLMGAVVNKVWPQKYTRIKEATAKGLENIGIRSFGAVPYEEVLASPTVGQVAQQLEGEVLCGQPALGRRVKNTIVAAMEAQHMVNYLRDQALVITPGDRSDNILAIISTHMLAAPGTTPPIAGVIVTGGFRPTGQVMNLLATSGLPTILCRQDTYSLAARLQEMVFKLTPDDKERIQAAMCLINEYVDIDGILEGLKE